MFVFCKAFEEVGECCTAVLCPRDRPSPLFTIFAWCINIAVIIVTAVHISGDAGEKCDNDKTTLWNWGMLTIAGMNMLFAIYIYCRFVCKVRNEGLEAHSGATAQSGPSHQLQEWRCCQL